METRGILDPATADDAREQYAMLAPAAATVVRETARAMGLDREAYAEATGDDVIETAHDALFASLLRVTVGSREAFNAAMEDPDATAERVTIGSENVDRVVWHVALAADTTVAATFQNEPDAAVDTLRRQAFGRIYREIVR